MPADTIFVFALIGFAAILMASNRVRFDMVTLVVEPGRYGFLSFIKIGVPLLLLTYAATALVISLIFPS